MKTSKQLNRRRFLSGLTRGGLAATAVLVIDQVVRFLSFQPSDDDGKIVPVGKPADFPYSALTYVPEARVYVGRDAQGLYAIDAVCPHLGCLVELEKDGSFTCPCHGSHFDTAGLAQAGPTTKPLRHLQLGLEQDGQLMVDRTQPAAPTTRLML
jgi:Rieske Fe-S protein